MNVIRDIREFPDIPYPVATSGTFDGVHKGHQKILNRLKEEARKNNGKSVLITFWPHPRLILSKKDQINLLTTLDEKIEILAKNGLDYLLILPFTRDFSELSAEEYVQKVLLDGVGVKKMILGYDHRFGKNREGNFNYLEENKHQFGFELEEIPRQDIEHIGISSTKIRKDLENGKVHEANAFLGRRYSVEGIVVRGDQLGRSMGYPTANINVKEDYKLIPSDGIYAVCVEVNEKKHKGMLNIGIRPTVGEGNKTIEVNIFDFSDDIYGNRIKISFIKKVRDEQKFDSLDQLKDQLRLDKEKIEHLLKNEEI